MIREKKIKSGPLLEIDFFPVFSDGRRLPTRSGKRQKSKTAQERYNHLVSCKKLIRFVNANFSSDDYYMHPTYDQIYAPRSYEEAKRDIVNTMRRFKTARASEKRRLTKELEELTAIAHPSKTVQKIISALKNSINKLQEQLKYIYVIESVTYKSGVKKGQTNYHFHLFVTGGLDRDRMESIWNKGVRVNCNNYQPEKFGPEAAAKYMSKDPAGKKRYVCSRNLEKPVVSKPKDGKITRQGVSKLATERIDDREYWERRYPGYRFLRCYARYNEYNGNWYVSAIMYKTNAGTVPGFEMNEWIEDEDTDIEI